MTNNQSPIYIADYNYPLPDERIARYPLPERDHSKLLVYRDGHVSEDHFYNVGDYIAPHSLLVYNNTRVIQARLEFHKPTGARIEVFCLEPLAPHDYQLSLGSTTGCTWKCMVGNARKWKHPIEIEVPMEGRVVRILAERGEAVEGTFEVTFTWTDSNVSFAEWIEAYGKVPLPPYIRRDAEESDTERYQTVYACHDGSVAARNISVSCSRK